MPQDRTLKAIKTRSRSEQVSVISLLFLPLLGLCCLLLPEASTMALPFVLGGIMAVSGIGGIVHAAAGAKRDEGDGDGRGRAAEHAILGKAIVMSVLGIVILVQGHASISFVGVMWGLLGLYKAADEIDEVVHALISSLRIRPFSCRSTIVAVIPPRAKSARISRLILKLLHLHLVVVLVDLL